MAGRSGKRLPIAGKARSTKGPKSKHWDSGTPSPVGRSIKRVKGVRMKSIKPLFSLGQIVSTPGALGALARANQQPDHFLNRHVTGDWGAELSEEDKAENEY